MEDTEYPAVPLHDEYNPLLIQFNELAAQGYPVSLEPTAAPSLGELTGSESDFAYLKSQQVEVALYGQDWALPTVHDETFATHLDLVEHAVFGDDNQTQALFDTAGNFWAMKQIAENHPIQLAWDIGRCSVSSIVQYNALLRRGVEPITMQPMDVRALMPGCFMAGMQRYYESQRLGDVMLSRLRPLNEAMHTKYQAMQQEGITPIPPAVLQLLISDYYNGVAQLSPQFAQFAKRQ